MHRTCRPVACSGLLAGLVAAAGCGKPPAPLAPPDAPQVTAKVPAVRAYTPIKEFTGRLVTKDPVKVMPQVSGMVVRRAFNDGDRVKGPVRLFGAVLKPGTLLFEIDKAQFEADLNKAKADVARAEADTKNWVAQIKLAEAELARADEGYKRSATPKTDLDKAVANLDVAKAQLDVAKATRDATAAAARKAAENLGYCTITAPATGIVRQAQVAERSIVDAYRTELVEVTPTDPVYCVFDVDELTSLWYRAEIFEKKSIPNPLEQDTPLRCWITLKNGWTYPPADRPGFPVQFIDPEIARGTGTRTIRATIPNPDRRLSGGDSVQVRVSAGTQRQVLTVPETAVFAQQRRRYVYVAVGGPEGDRAELREVEPGDSIDGQSVIEKGLTTADRVIVDNLLRVRPGIKVQVKQ